MLNTVDLVPINPSSTNPVTQTMQVIPSEQIQQIPQVQHINPHFLNMHQFQLALQQQQQQSQSQPQLQPQPQSGQILPIQQQQLQNIQA